MITEICGYTVERVEVCGSTNDELKARAPGLPERYVLIADRQTRGKGRLGRSFYSPEGTGLYMSVLLRPGLDIGDVTLITPAAAVAVCRAAESLFPVRAGIKWVNDIQVEGRKVCGILTEARTDRSGGLESVVLGIGVNIAPPPGGFPEDISGTAGWLTGSDRPGLRLELAAAILREFDGIYASLPGRGFVDEYRSRSVLLGRDVTVLRDEPFAARAVDVDMDCGLVLLLPDGTRETLRTGEVSVRERGVL